MIGFTVAAWKKSGRRKANPTPPRRPRYFRPTVELLEDRLAPSTANWIGPATGGNWSTIGDWSGGSGTGGSPGTGDDVTINNATVTYNSGTLPINSLTLTSATLTDSGGSLTISNPLSIVTVGTFDLKSGGTVNLSGTSLNYGDSGATSSCSTAAR